MSQRITKADIDVQAAILAAYSQAAGIMQDGDRLAIDRGMNSYALHIVPAGGSNRSNYPATKMFGSIGATAREAFHTLNVMQETMRATLDALGVAYVFPADAVASIRGER
jgi:hypothetical protein